MNAIYAALLLLIVAPAIAVTMSPDETAVIDVSPESLFADITFSLDSHNKGYRHLPLGTRRRDLSKQIDEAFYERADAYIRVATEQLAVVPSGRVSASLMYACARFNVWVSASGRNSAGELRKAYGETIEYFVAEYRKMLVKNLDDYIENFNQYVQQVPDTSLATPEDHTLVTP